MYKTYLDPPKSPPIFNKNHPLEPNSEEKRCIIVYRFVSA